MNATIKEKFFRRVQKSESCWLWTGPKNNRRYGRFKFGSINLAHRAAWFFEHGEIPDGLCVLHRCDVRHCVNPEYLFLGTNKDNTDDMLFKKRDRHPKGEDARSAKLTSKQVISIRDRYFSGEATQVALAKEHGMYRSNINAIIRRDHWGHLPPSEIEKNYLPVPEASTIAEMLLSKRKLFNLSQTALALKSGISSCYISQLEKGKTQCSAWVFNKLKSAMEKLSQNQTINQATL